MVAEVALREEPGNALIDVVDQVRAQLNSQLFCLFLLLSEDLDTLPDCLVDVVVLETVDQVSNLKFPLKPQVESLHFVLELDADVDFVSQDVIHLVLDMLRVALIRSLLEQYPAQLVRLVLENLSERLLNVCDVDRFLVGVRLISIVLVDGFSNLFLVFLGDLDGKYFTTNLVKSDEILGGHGVS